MGLCYNLCAAEDARGEVLKLWDVVGRIEGTSSMRELGYPPHVTLAVYEADGVDEACARSAFEHCAGAGGRLDLRFDSVRAFAGPPMVLWLAPDACDALGRIHAALHEAIDPRLSREHYCPGRWTPHCTLGTRIGPEGERAASELMATFRDGLTVTFDALECVAFPPLRTTLRHVWWAVGSGL